LFDVLTQCIKKILLHPLKSALSAFKKLHYQTMLKLLKIRGFLAYLIIAFLNAFTDLGHKIIIQNTIFKFYDGTTQVVLTALVNACIVLPFVLFFTPTGFLADKFPKNRIITIAAALAIPLTGMITFSYYMGWFEVAFAMTLLLGVQAAFYSPAKYGYIKELVGKENIAGANAYVQAITIVAILGGTVAFSVLFEKFIAPDAASVQALVQSIAPLGWLLVAFSVIEFLLTFRLPKKHETDTELHFNVRKYATFGYLRENLGKVRAQKVIWLSIIAISVFWGINQVVLATFPSYLKDTLGVHDTVLSNGLLGVGGLGVIIGSFIAGKASEEFIETGVVPLGALGVTVSLFVLPSIHSLWLIAALFLVYGIMGGLFIIPLNALIQFNADSDEAGTVLSASNFMQNLLMTVFLLATAVLTDLYKLQSVWMLYAMAVVSSIGAVFTLSRLPQAFVRYVVMVMASQRYKLQVLGMKNIPSTGGVLLLGNHASWFDWAMLQIASPRPIRYVMLRSIYEMPVLRPLLNIFGVIPIAPGKDAEESLTNITEALRNGDVVAMFPEGRISRNGQLANFKRGYERAVAALPANVDAVIVPFYLRGLWGTAFSYATRHQQRSGLQGGKRLVTVAFGERLPIQTTAAFLKQKVSELSQKAWRNYAQTLDSVPMAFLKSAKHYALDIALVNHDKRRMTSINLLTQTINFAQATKRVSSSTHIGILLPTSAEAVISSLSVMMNGKTAVLLDYTHSAEDIATGMRLQAISVVFSTRGFVDTLIRRFPNLAQILGSVEVIYVEDYTKRIQPSLAKGVFTRFAPNWLLRSLYFAGHHKSVPAVTIFAGKAATLRPVELSHGQIKATIKQITEVLNPHENDTVLAVLPMCTAFGVISSVFMPLLSGIQLVCAENAAQEGDMIALGRFAARNEASVLFAEPAQLRDFAENPALHSIMFSTLRLVVTGSDGVSDGLESSTYALFRQKFGVNVYEGFGTPASTPIASVNVPDVITPGEWNVQVGTKPNTVGMPLPGCTFTIVDEKTGVEKAIGEVGSVRIGAPYTANTEMANTETDVRGSLDEDGFLTIVR
jgi:acyl-[acyl-carrier-protein]-phospholipid O-acyltransferase/long-chain-fatty-acid--[acyl-carrier-protein] ligase